MKFYFTEHAVERFIQRCNKSLSYEDALGLLTEHSFDAVKLREKTFGGQFKYQIAALACVLVCKYDVEGIVVVTVLPIEEGPVVMSLSEEEMEWLEKEAQASRDICAKLDKVLTLDIPADEISDYYKYSSRSQAQFNEVDKKVVALRNAIAALASSIQEAEKRETTLVNRLRKEAEALQTCNTHMEAKRDRLLEETKMLEQRLIDMRWDVSGTFAESRTAMSTDVFTANEKARAATNALRFAVRGLFGEMDRQEALEAIATLNLGFIQDEFYQSAKTIKEIAEEANADSSCV